jgi:DNA-binding response OmpR family regulator
MWGEASPALSAPTRGSGMNRILVVDNEPDLRSTYDRLLRWQGYRVVTAGSRAEGLRLVTEPPRLVIVDLKLRDGDGLDIIRAAKANHPPVPVIVVTSFASAASRRAAQASGAAAFLTKPFSASELLELVRIEFERTLS